MPLCKQVHPAPGFCPGLTSAPTVDPNPTGMLVKQFCLCCSWPGVFDGSLLPLEPQAISNMHYCLCVISSWFTSPAQSATLSFSPSLLQLTQASVHLTHMISAAVRLKNVRHTECPAWHLECGPWRERASVLVQPLARQVPKGSLLLCEVSVLDLSLQRSSPHL